MEVSYRIGEKTRYVWDNYCPNNPDTCNCPDCTNYKANTVRTAYEGLMSLPFNHKPIDQLVEEEMNLNKSIIALWFIDKYPTIDWKALDQEIDKLDFQKLFELARKVKRMNRDKEQVTA